MRPYLVFGNVLVVFDDHIMLAHPGAKLDPRAAIEHLVAIQINRPHGAAAK